MKRIAVGVALAGGSLLLAGCGFFGKEIADPGSVGQNYRMFVANDRIARRQVPRDAHAWYNLERARWPRFRDKKDSGGEGSEVSSSELSIATFVR